MIGIVCFSNLRGVPYLQQYTNILDKLEQKYDIYIWNRHNLKENVNCNKLYSYNLPLDDSSNKIDKLFAMNKYCKFVKKELKINKYDKLIILTSLPGVLMCLTLKFKYNKRYIFDIRDHSYEHISFYYYLMNMVMKNSLLNVISSEGFKEFLPPRQTILCHNYNVQGNYQNNMNNKKQEITISFIGQIRYANAYKKIIKQLVSSDRISFNFYGFGGDEIKLKQYCKENNLKKVYFHGSYKPDEKSEIIKKTDVIFNVYGDDLHVKYAVSNKYYDALCYKKPLIVNYGTTMHLISKNISYAVDEKFDVENFIKWYDSLDFNKLCGECEKLLDRVEEEQKKFYDTVIKLLRT